LIAHSGNSEMKKVFDLAMNNQEWKKITKLYEFWLKYWDELIPHLTLRLPIWKDIVLNHLWDSDFKEYNDFYIWMQTDKTYNLKNDDISNWAYDADEDGNPIWPDAWKRKYYEQYFKLDTSWWYGVMWNTLFNATIKQLTDLKYSNLSVEDKKKIYTKFMIALEPAVREWTQWKFDTEAFKKTNIANNLTRLWLDIINDQFIVNEKTDVANWLTWAYRYAESENFQKYIDRCFERFMKNNSVQDSMNNVSENTRKSALEILEWLKNAA
jgi:hypothetical protein